ncbi:MAG: HAD family hydrolase [Oceanipulchritudo sp.]|jgi:phosphoglycolate phosphatase
MKRTYEAVLWDWNGTLLEDSEYGLDIINRMLERRGLPVPSRAEHGRLFDFPVIRYYERLGFDFEKEPFEQLSHEFVADYYRDVHTCSLRRGARGVLEAVRARGCRQLVLSASRQDLLEEMIAHHGLEPYFEALLGIDSVHAPGKGARGCEWIRGGSTDPARVLLIGDTVHDSEVAEEMGIDCWLVHGGHHAPDRLEATGRRCFRDLAELGGILAATEAGRVRV